MKLMEFVEASNRVETTDALYDLFQKELNTYGFDRNVFGGTRPNHGFSAAEGVPPDVPVIFANYPEDWAHYYLANQYAAIDPIIAAMPRMWRPLVWADIAQAQELSKQQVKMMRECGDAGLNNGLSIPIHGPQGETFVVSLASGYTGDLQPHRLMNELRALSMQFFCAFADLARQEVQDPPVRLAPREMECLLWSARGESAWEIGMILNLSANTVNCYLKGAFVKLGTSNRILAIVKAIRMGLISP